MSQLPDAADATSILASGLLVGIGALLIAVGAALLGPEPLDEAGSLLAGGLVVSGGVPLAADFVGAIRVAAGPRSRS